MTYSVIVQTWNKGIGAFDWPEGVGPLGPGAKRHKICVTCTILFEIEAPMLHCSSCRIHMNSLLRFDQFTLTISEVQ